MTSEAKPERVQILRANFAGYIGLTGTVLQRCPRSADPLVRFDFIPEGCTSDRAWFSAKQVRSVGEGE